MTYYIHNKSQNIQFYVHKNTQMKQSPFYTFDKFTTGKNNVNHFFKFLKTTLTKKETMLYKNNKDDDIITPQTSINSLFDKHNIRFQ